MGCCLAILRKYERSKGTKKKNEIKIEKKNYMNDECVHSFVYQVHVLSMAMAIILTKSKRMEEKKNV